jgi:hypothetical protein
MVMMVSPVSVNFNASPEINYSRRSFIPVGEVGNFAKNSGEFTPEELEVIKKTPFLASRIEAAADKGTIIGYRDTYKNRADILEARQAYNLAVNNPKEFYKSEFPAYIVSNDVDAATQIVQNLYDVGETPESIGSLYESSLQSAPEYSQTYAEKRAINWATQGSSDPLGISKYIKPFFTTVGAIAGGPVGAAIVNSIVQLGQTGKIDPKETAKVAAIAYVGQELTSPSGVEAAPVGGGTDYSLLGGGADVGGLGFQADPGMLAPDIGASIGAGGIAAGGPGLVIDPGALAPSLGVNLGVASLTPDYSLLGGADTSLIGQTGITPGTPGIGLQPPTLPSLGSMGGGQGLSVPVEGGTVTQGGFTPTGAVPVLGDSSSFINDPNVLGQDVINVEPSSLSLRDAFDAARNIRRVAGLLGGGGGGGEVGGGGDPGQMPAGSVDVSNLLALLSGAGVRTPNVYSLLG